jgi:predicted transposase YbfD/YdcC
LHNEVQDYFELIDKDGKLEADTIRSNHEVHEIKVGNGFLGMSRTVEKGHGRIEKRTYYYSTDTSWMIDAKKEWEGLNGIGMVIREVEFLGKEREKTVERAYYIGSVTFIGDFSRAVRNHWGVESMHWSLDVTFKDDENRTRKGTAPQNMAVLKRIAFNAVKADISKYPKQSMKGKRFIALMNPKYRDYLLRINYKESEQVTY